MDKGQSMAEVDEMGFLWYLELLAWKLAGDRPAPKYLRDMLR